MDRAWLGLLMILVGAPSFIYGVHRQAGWQTALKVGVFTTLVLVPGGFVRLAGGPETGRDPLSWSAFALGAWLISIPLASHGKPLDFINLDYRKSSPSLEPKSGEWPTAKEVHRIQIRACVLIVLLVVAGSAV